MEKFDVRKAVSLESQYDDALKTRPISAWLGTFVFCSALLLHYTTISLLALVCLLITGTWALTCLVFWF